MNNGHLKPDVSAGYETVGCNLVIDVIELYPKFRGNGLGSVEVQRIVDLFWAACALVTCTPSPMQLTLDFIGHPDNHAGEYAFESRPIEQLAADTNRELRMYLVLIMVLVMVLRDQREPEFVNIVIENWSAFGVRSSPNVLQKRVRAPVKSLKVDGLAL